ncbi:MAG: hypothetical protein MI924_05035 [Chloroflexales bacterium]|nr:hypothetical protein [Chloroflexales bacterium]
MEKRHCRLGLRLSAPDAADPSVSRNAAPVRPRLFRPAGARADQRGGVRRGIEIRCCPQIVKATPNPLGIVGAVTPRQRLDGVALIRELSV